MAKPRLHLRVRIPPYRAPRNAWRRSLNALTGQRQKQAGIWYRESDRLEVHIRLYMDTRSLRSHDVDNRLKDILDALQGRAGGSKRVRLLPAIVPNDRQIYRVSIEKGLAPWQSHGLGHLVIRKFRARPAVLNAAALDGARAAFSIGPAGSAAPQVSRQALIHVPGQNRSQDLEVRRGTIPEPRTHLHPRAALLIC